MEIDDLLQGMMDDHSKRRSTISFAPLLTPPEAFSPTDEPVGSHSYSDHSFPSLVLADTLYNCDSDTPSLTSSSPSLKSKRSFTPITPSTDGWRSPPTLLTVPEHGGDLASNDHLCVPSEDRRVRNTNLPPLRMTIPEESTIQRRGKNPSPSEQTLFQDDSYRIEPSIDCLPPSHFSDDDTPESTEIGYVGSDIEPAYPSTTNTVPLQTTQLLPWLEFPQGPGSYSGHGGRSPTSSVSLISNGRRSSSPKRSVFRTIFSQSNISGRKKERDQEKAYHPIQTQFSAAQPVETASVTSTSSKSSKDKGRNRGEKAARRAQLAEQLKAKQPAQTLDNSRRDPPKPTTSWEEKGGMFGVDGVF